MNPFALQWKRQVGPAVRSKEVSYQVLGTLTTGCLVEGLTGFSPVFGLHTCRREKRTTPAACGCSWLASDRQVRRRLGLAI